MFETAALIFTIIGGAVVAYNVSGKKISLQTGTVNNFTDHAGNSKYFDPQKMVAWGSIQDYIVYILTGKGDWNNWIHLHSFRRLTNGGKIDAVWEQVMLWNGEAKKYGYAGSSAAWAMRGANSFSYLDFYYPGIDIDNLGAGSENEFEMLWHDLNPVCIGTVISGAIATVGSGGTLSIPAVAASAAACKT